MHKATLKRLMPPVVFILVWGVLFVGDWFFRFERFRWQDQFVIRPYTARNTNWAGGPEKPMAEIAYEATTGGDLTRLAAAGHVTKEYGEPKPSTIISTDEHGYRNKPPTDHVYYPILLVGDSFMHVQYGDDGSFALQLESKVNKRIYNHAFPGQGAFRSMRNYLASDRFSGRRPKVIVWGVLEREIGGGAFSSYLHQLNMINEPESRVDSSGFRFNWSALQPVSLTRGLPGTSIMSAAFNRLWSKLRYPIFGSMMSAVVPSLPDHDGNRMLFYHYNLEALKWTAEQRDAPRVVTTLSIIRDQLKAQGTELLVLLIPDKPQVYRDRLMDSRDIQPSTLYDVESGLSHLKVPVINLLPAFIDAKSAGVPLYWRDDTHWRPEGMSIAADLTLDWLNNFSKK